MRTNVDIDDTLMADAMTALGTHGKKETIEVALERAIRDWKLSKIRSLRGTVEWNGDLAEWRRSKDFPLDGAG
jgi:Arc/MetJ family transcription regulator